MVKRKQELSGEAFGAINGMLLWRSSRPQEFVEKLGRVVWEVVLAKDEDGVDELAERMESGAT